jgi:hypothetical protein
VQRHTSQGIYQYVGCKYKNSHIQERYRKLEYVDDFRSRGICLLLVCVIMVLSQIDVYNCSTLKNRCYYDFVDNPFIERTPDFVVFQRPR